MQRPIMDVQYMREADDAPPVRRRRDWAKLLLPLRRLAGFAGQVGVMLLATPWRRTRHEAAESGPPVYRAVRGLMYRLMFLPALLTLVAAVLVYLATHPRSYAGDLDPISIGVYYDPVTLVAADGVRSEAWLAPAVDARKVLAGGERALRRRSPGVVLVHDMGQTARQMLPLVRPLHQAGYVVLVVGVRGSMGAEPVGQTFGLNESLDVRAGVDMLRRRPFVDPRHVAVIGVGTGAMASLLAREQDPTINSLVLIDLPADADRLVTRSMSQRSPLLKWLTPICRWTFEVAYQTSLRDVSPTRLAKLADAANALRVEGVLADGLATKADRVEPIRAYLDARFAKRVARAP